MRTKFKYLRKMNRLTVQALTDRFSSLGYIIDRGIIYRLESEKQQNYSIYILEAYTELFNVSADYLLGIGE